MTFDNETNNSNSTSMERNFLLLSRVRLVVKFYIWPLLVIFGLTGNCLSILVLTRRRLIRTSTNNYLTILAAFDSCYLILTLILNFGSHPSVAQNVFIQSSLEFLRPLADFSSNTATWLIVCFTVERTLAVAKPMYAKRTCSVRRSRHFICTVLTLCFLITIPTYLENQFLNNPPLPTMNNQSDAINDRQKAFLIFHRLYLVFICVVIIWIPLTLLCICNSILIWYVHRSRRFENDVVSTPVSETFYRSTSNSNNFVEYSSINYSKPSLSSPSTPLKSSYTCHLRRHNHSYLQKRKVTIVLIFCLCVALLLWTPQSLSLTYETLIESYTDMSPGRRILLLIFNNFANLFLCINASIDFILYCFLSENFARTFKQIMFRQCSTYQSKFVQRSRFISFDRMSFGYTNPTNNLLNQQQQSAATNTNNYYVQLYNQNRPSTQMKIDRGNQKWRKRFVPSSTDSSNPSRRHQRVLYQTSLLRNQSKMFNNTKLGNSKCALQFHKSVECLSNTEEDCINQEFDASIQTLISSNRQSPPEIQPIL